MKTQLVVMTLAVLLVAEVILALPFTEQDDTSGDEYKEDYDRFLENPIKRSYPEPYLGDRRDEFPIRLPRFSRRRSCVRRGDRCDHRRDDCCNNTTCRCSLFGNNCVCERMGLFQQWGK